MYSRATVQTQVSGPLHHAASHLDESTSDPHNCALMWMESYSHFIDKNIKSTPPSCWARSESRTSDSRSPPDHLVFFPVCLSWAFIFLYGKLRSTYLPFSGSQSLSHQGFSEGHVNQDISDGYSSRALGQGWRCSPALGLPAGCPAPQKGPAPRVALAWVSLLYRITQSHPVVIRNLIN